MSVKKYIIGLALTFAAGVGVGAYFSKDISYALCKTERVAHSTDIALRKVTPETAKKFLDAYESTYRKTVFGMEDNEANQKRIERMEKLDKVINDYESKKK